ncbi:MAG: alpha/beta fold hydrolase [Ilumatobacteraceae bacterium]
MRIPSSDDVSVAVHDLAGGDDPGRPLLLIAHASGFHAHAYLPLAERLAPPFNVLGMDFRGHGDTARPDDWLVDWRRYGDDALAVADALGRRAPLTAFGHSMGGAALLMAASRQPDLFRLLVLYEPIVFPPDADRPEGPNLLAAGARRRRAVFPSFEAAVENYASKPPLGGFDPAALDAYVRYGFAPDGSGGVRLKCDPEHEARTFEQGGLHRTWDLLAGIEVPVVVIAGRVDEQQPSRIAEAVAAELPNGRYVGVPDLDHFGPFTDPARLSRLVLDAAERARD